MKEEMEMLMADHEIGINNKIISVKSDVDKIKDIVEKMSKVVHDID